MNKYTNPTYEENQRLNDEMKERLKGDIDDPFEHDHGYEDVPPPEKLRDMHKMGYSHGFSDRKAIYMEEEGLDVPGPLWEEGWWEFINR